MTASGLQRSCLWASLLFVLGGCEPSAPRSVDPGSSDGAPLGSELVQRSLAELQVTESEYQWELDETARGLSPERLRQPERLTLEERAQVQRMVDLREALAGLREEQGVLRGLLALRALDDVRSRAKAERTFRKKAEKEASRQAMEIGLQATPAAVPTWVRERVESVHRGAGDSPAPTVAGAERKGAPTRVSAPQPAALPRIHAPAEPRGQVTVAGDVQFHTERRESGPARLAGGSSTWTFRNGLPVAVTFDRYRLRLWNWYPGSSPAAKSLLESVNERFRREILDTAFPLDGAVTVAPGGEEKLAFDERGEAFRNVNYMIPKGLSALYEFFGTTTRGDEVRVEAKAPQGFAW